MHDLQVEIPFKTTEVDIETVRRQKSMGDALDLSQRISGLEDKQICDSVGIDKATLSKVKSNQAGLTGARYDRFANITGNEVALIWWADRRGYCLTPLETELEKRLRLEREEKERLAAENALLRDLVTKRS